MYESKFESTLGCVSTENIQPFQNYFKNLATEKYYIGDYFMHSIFKNQTDQRNVKVSLCLRPVVTSKIIMKLVMTPQSHNPSYHPMSTSFLCKPHNDPFLILIDRILNVHSFFQFSLRPVYCRES